jgi:hypothetical protein
MTFTILKKIRGASGHYLENGKGDLCRDDTDTTNYYEDCFENLDGTIHEVNSSGISDDSMESAFVELQHELREKTSQCTILRETLSTMSATMRRHEFQLKEKIAALEENVTLINEKTAECQEWKEKYEALVSKIEKEATNTEVHPAAPNISDDLLLGSYKYESYTNRKPWQKKTVEVDKICDELSTATDSIDDQYGSELDAVYSPKRSPKRSVKPKGKFEASVEMKKLPMSWLSECNVNVEVPKEYVLNDTNDDDNNKPFHEVHCISSGKEHSQENEEVPESKEDQVDKEFQLNEINGEENENQSMSESTVKESGKEQLKAPETLEQSCKIEYLELKDSSNDQLDSSWGNIEHHFDVDALVSHEKTESTDLTLEIYVDLTTQKDYGETTCFTATDAETVDEEHMKDEASLNPKNADEIEVLPLNQFMQLYDSVMLDDAPDCSCAHITVDDDDSMSVLSFATVDSAGPAFATIKSIDEKNVDKSKDAGRLRSRVIRTAKREAQKAQFPCEVVEC